VRLRACAVTASCSAGPRAQRADGSPRKMFCSTRASLQTCAPSRFSCPWAKCDSKLRLHVNVKTPCTHTMAFRRNTPPTRHREERVGRSRAWTRAPQAQGSSLQLTTVRTWHAVFQLWPKHRTEQNHSLCFSRFQKRFGNTHRTWQPKHHKPCLPLLPCGQSLPSWPSPPLPLSTAMSAPSKPPSTAASSRRHPRAKRGVDLCGTRPLRAA
jgi:hypothetical protein